MKESPILRPPRQPLLVVRKEFIEICGGNQAAGIMLGILDYWTTVRLEHIEITEKENSYRNKRKMSPLPVSDTWIFKSYCEWIENSLGLLHRYQIPTAAMHLEMLGFIKRRQNSQANCDRRAVAFDRTMHYQLQVEAINEKLKALYFPDSTRISQHAEIPILMTEDLPSHDGMPNGAINGREITSEINSREREKPAPLMAKLPSLSLSINFAEKEFTLSPEQITGLQAMNPHKPVQKTWDKFVSTCINKGIRRTEKYWLRWFSEEFELLEPVKAASMENRKPEATVKPTRCPLCENTEGWQLLANGAKRCEHSGAVAAPAQSVATAAAATL
jgi:hypothetical protein